MLKRAVLAVLVAALCFAAVPVNAGEVTLTTYYPAPKGNYDELNSNTATVGGACIGDCTGGPTHGTDLEVKGSTMVEENLTAEGVTRVGGGGGFVLRPGNPSTNEEGTIWIAS